MLLEDIQLAPITIGIDYSYRSCIPGVPLADEYTVIVRWIVSQDDSNGNTRVRPVFKKHPIRRELEIMYFGRKHLLYTFDKGKHKVMSLLFALFADAFGLYRNMYRSLIGIYCILAGLTAQERNRTTNVFPLTLGPYSSNIAGVVETIGMFLRALDSGKIIDIDGRKVMLCAITFVFLGDILQQQENAGMLSQKATIGCRFCLTVSNDRGNLDADLVSNSKYYWELERIRQFIANLSMTATTTRTKFARTFGMDPNPPTIYIISPALDMIVSKPSEPVYSELNGISGIAHGLLVNNILTTEAKFTYAEQLRSIVFPLGWQRLQSPIYHLGSYSLSEHRRWSIVVVLVLLL